MRKFGYIAAGALSTLLPMVASAQGALDTVIRLAQDFGGLVGVLIPIVVSLAVLAFFWGLAKYVFAAGDESAKDQGKRIMIWGGIALFVIFSIWGIIRIVQQSFEIDLNNSALDAGSLVPTGLP